MAREWEGFMLLFKALQMSWMLLFFPRGWNKVTYENCCRHFCGEICWRAGLLSAGKEVGALGAGQVEAMWCGCVVLVMLMLLLPMWRAAGALLSQMVRACASLAWKMSPPVADGGVLPAEQPVLQPAPFPVLPHACRQALFLLGRASRPAACRTMAVGCCCCCSLASRGRASFC